MSTTQLTPLDSYLTNIFADSAAEIVVFDPLTDLLFVTNTANNTLDILNASDPSNLSLVSSIDLSTFGGGVNSVTVNDGIVAVAVEANAKQNPGKVVFFDFSNFELDDDDDGIQNEIDQIVEDVKQVEVGALPDMVTYTPDGTRVLVANEGESTDDFRFDPEGSISIIDVSTGHSRTADFNTFFQGKLEKLGKAGFINWFAEFQEQGFRSFGPTGVTAQGFIDGERFVDIEPEYIAVSPDSKTAWVALQENNALAKINLGTGAVEILPLGFKDHSQRGNELDASNRDGGINIRNWPVFGMYQPDSIAAYKARNGKTYVVTANEGDSRIRPDGDLELEDGTVIPEGDIFNEEERVGDVVLDPTAFPNAAELQLDENLGRLKITNTLGDTDGDGDFDQLYAYGARSFSIRDANGKLVFDSGADLERITAILNPKNFNSTDDENDSFDDRSDDKGPEPEALTVGQVGDRTYAFIGLEREGGILVYDITNPTDAELIQYINPRNFSGDLETTVANGTSGDVSPEGFTFISAADSPTGEPLLGVASEVSGSTTLYRIDPEAADLPGALSGTTGDEYLSGGASDDLILARAGNDTVRGGNGNDLIWGSFGRDLLRGDDGNDNLYGGEGNDRLYGGDDSDFLKGGEGDDALYGGDGDDFFDGGYGFDHFDGGAGNDTVTLAYRHGGVDIDLYYGKISFLDQGGYETLRSIENAIGTEYGDYIEGNNGNNRLQALGGNDTSWGGFGNDTIEGGAGKDKLYGEGGNDQLYGGAGDDALFGIDANQWRPGRGEIDILVGGLGRDRFVLGDKYRVYYDDGSYFSSGFGDYAHIKDFNAAQGDVIQLRGSASDYTLGSALNSTGIFLKSSGANELIGVVDGLSSSLTSSAFTYV